MKKLRGRGSNPFVFRTLSDVTMEARNFSSASAFNIGP
jgi:hypothetical protein